MHHRAYSARRRLHGRGYLDRKSTRLNSSHLVISYAVFCLKKMEAAGYFNKTATDCRHAMEQAGWRCVSTHHTLSALRSFFSYKIASAPELSLLSLPGAFPV